ncbi:hypothetical protein [Nitrosospira multiformis]|uniref:Uncharacterized protein n=1 Tax=Nitrosospira multiformis TaxID=1231 RepID=A0A1I7IW92_9PROT|nr:hypothetical protein [Nitrosospira multiformis]SFU77152.1 hypothetical protein SAMN05216417_1291 [Nitrosospira multiformis]
MDKTYASAKGAKAAAKKAGLDPQQVTITEVETDEGVRYGYRVAEAPAAVEVEEQVEAVVNTAAEGEAEVPAAEVTTPAKPKKVRVVREERNGVKRPLAGGLCAAVWDYLDEKGNLQPKDLREVAATKGWNVNNVQIELYQWRKFNGLSKKKKAETAA